MNWETVATSMLTSGGILFAAYKIWFQRRLEDHKLSLQNNGKLFELELKALEEFSQITQEILDSDLGIKIQLSEQEVFIIKSYKNEQKLSEFIKRYSHLISNKLNEKLTSLVALYRELQEETKSYISPNTSYGGGKYSAYNNLPASSIEKAGLCRVKTLKAYESFKSEVYKRAGRKT
ncbi:hypothetical protein [Thiomicrorhabdus sp.]|uniref:hypothetical protein n=1 Tax=Thiomicrorhabdus sp. TaxID=2039724 RepID=UPI0029C92AF8|nr:hypothetical protein [Thiomicrorhabdus sp.]